MLNKYIKNIDIKCVNLISSLGALRSPSGPGKLLPAHSLSMMLVGRGSRPGAHPVGSEHLIPVRLAPPPHPQEATVDVVPGRAAGDFSKPTLDSVHTELACVWSLGRLHGSRISIRQEGEGERGKILSKPEHQIHPSSQSSLVA